MAEAEQANADYKEHREAYDGFIRVTKWGIAAVAVVLLLMAFFLT